MQYEDRTPPVLVKSVSLSVSVHQVTPSKSKCLHNHDNPRDKYMDAHFSCSCLDSTSPLFGTRWGQDIVHGEAWTCRLLSVSSVSVTQVSRTTSLGSAGGSHAGSRTSTMILILHTSIWCIGCSKAVSSLSVNGLVMQIYLCSRSGVGTACNSLHCKKHRSISFMPEKAHPVCTTNWLNPCLTHQWGWTKYPTKTTKEHGVEVSAC